MNQRNKRASDRKNNVGQISIGSSAHPARQNVNHDPAEVVIPQRATGDKPTLRDRLVGLAKASPLFQQVEPEEVASQEDESRAIAESTVEDDNEDN